MPNDNNGSVQRRKFLQGAAGGAAALGLAGCLGGDPEDGNGNGDDGDDTDGTDVEEDDIPRDSKLFIGQSKAPVHFDPVEQMDVDSQYVGERIYSLLYTFDEGIGLQPSDLTTDLPEVSREGERYVIEIVDYAEFHNGDPVTSEDVQYMIEQPLEEGTRMAESFEMVDETEIIDDTTLQVDLEYPYGFFPIQLSHHVAPKAVREDDLDTFRNEQPIGSGPFRFVDWVQGEYVEIERWDDYWGDLDPNIAEVEYIPIEENTTRVTNLQTGEVDMMDLIPPSLWDTVQDMDDSTVYDQQGLNYYYFAFNCLEGPTADLQVREALGHCINETQAVENFVNPAGVRQYSPANPAFVEEWDFPAEDWQAFELEQDTDQAASMLDDAGVPDDYEFTIICPPDDMREELSVSLANGIQDAGYDAQVERLGWGTFIDVFTSGDPEDYNVYILGRGSTPDLPRLLYSLWHREPAGVNNGVHFDPDHEIHDLMEEAQREPDRDMQRQMQMDIIDMALENRLHIPMYGLVNTWAAKDFVHDYSTHAISQMNPRLVSDYNNVWVDR